MTTKPIAYGEALQGAYSGFVVVTHCVSRVQLEKDRLSVYNSFIPMRISTSKVIPIVHENAKPEPGMSISFDTTRVLVDSPESLQQSLIRADAAGAFGGSPMTFNRVKPK